MIRSVLAILFLVALGLNAQQPATNPQATPHSPDAVAQPSAAAPKLTEDDILTLSTLNTLLSVANRDCQGLDSVKAYTAQRTAIATRLETKYPGFTLNGNGNGLIAKAPAPPAGK
jgi:hypothetical protein